MRGFVFVMNVHSLDTQMCRKTLKSATELKLAASAGRQALQHHQCMLKISSDEGFLKLYL